MELKSLTLRQRIRLLVWDKYIAEPTAPRRLWLEGLKYGDDNSNA